MTNTTTDAVTTILSSVLETPATTATTSTPAADLDESSITTPVAKTASMNLSRQVLATILKPGTNTLRSMAELGRAMGSEVV